MVDLDWKTKMIASDLSSKSPKFSNKVQISIPPPKIRIAELSAASDSDCSAYEHYLRIPELRKLWSAAEFPGWKTEPVLKPAFIGLEITFRLISTVLSDPRPYANHREWRRRVEALAASQIEIIALLCEEDEEDPETRGTIPIVDLTSDGGVLAHTNSSAEVWRLSDETVVVSHVSEGSLLPRLGEWERYDAVTRKIQYSIECQMQGCPYTLGLGEPNLSGKPSLDYDLICKPSEIHGLKRCPSESGNLENQTLYATHQILESWIRVAGELLQRISEEIDTRRYGRAAGHCWALEKVWGLVGQIEDLSLAMDPEDLLRLKKELMIRASTESDLFCFRSRGLVGITKASKDLKHKVPGVLGVEVDPTGGPRIQDAAMELYRRRSGGVGDFARVHLLQAMQAVEAAVKGFYFSYRQLLAAVMGSLEGKGRLQLQEQSLLTQIFMEPTYFPSLDAAKTFLGASFNSI